MTENKRFMLDDCGELIDLNNHTFVDYGDGVCDLLNELQDKSDKKQAHIVLLEGKIHRMRDNIKRLEALYHYGGYIGSGDVKKEYYRREKLLKAENDQLKQEYQKLKHRHSLLHDMCCDLECDCSGLRKDVESLEAENKRLKQKCQELRNDLIDHSALIDMLEKAMALDIEDMIWNTMGYRTQTEFDDDFADYREYAKRRWKE